MLRRRVRRVAVVAFAAGLVTATATAAPTQAGATPAQAGATPARAGATVFDPDERFQVFNGLTVGRFGVAYLETPTATCTGYFVAPDTVVTAAHCIHSGGPGGGYVSDVVVWPGRNGNSTPLGSCVGRRSYASRGWRVQVGLARMLYDYGAVKVNCNLGKRIRRFAASRGVDVDTDRAYFAPTIAPPDLGQSISIPGYPADRSEATQWDAPGRVLDYAERLIAYRNDTFGGSSGGPVVSDARSCPFVDHGVLRHAPCAYGVNAYSGGPGAEADPAAVNIGVRFTGRALIDIDKWVARQV